MYLGVAPQESIAERNAEIEVERSEHAHLHVDELLPVVGVVADVQEVVDHRRVALLSSAKTSTNT